MRQGVADREITAERSWEGSSPLKQLLRHLDIPDRTRNKKVRLVPTEVVQQRARDICFPVVRGYSGHGIGHTFHEICQCRTTVPPVGGRFRRQG